MYISSRMPITSAMKETIFAVSRTVSPCAIWLLPSSRSCTARPSILHADAKEKRVRVELSRNRETASPLSKIRLEILFSRKWRSASATVNTASSSSRDFSQVRKKSPSYILFIFSFLSFSAYCPTLLIYCPLSVIVFICFLHTAWE
ncbi:MAG: hypothetical protein BWY62_00939 [Firmicutes bacterium ADurb.Bin356]|nr:MAG: hypothetical protein BWY62_00939 [Firmicutes bacterium ADurb.Bin356]